MSEEKTPLEKLKEVYGHSLGSINVDKEVGVPAKLRDALSLLNGVDREKMEKDLIDAALSEDEGGGGSGGATIVVAQKGKPGQAKYKEAQTVDDLIRQSQGPYEAMAVLLDKYIRLVISDEVD